MEKYIKEFDRTLIDQMESETNCDIEISEDFNQSIRKMCNEEQVSNIISEEIRGRKYRNLAASFAVILLTMIGTGVVANAATDGKIMNVLTRVFGAEEVNDDNRVLIGKEVVGESIESVENDVNVKLLCDSHIVDYINDDLLQPISINEFEVTNDVTPEVIMTNGAAVIFYKDDYEGWKCNEGDKLIFDFSRYESEVVEEQAIIVGYILDGVMYNSEEVFNGTDGRYEHPIEKTGEYYIYVISATSDYLTLDEGTVTVVKK